MHRNHNERPLAIRLRPMAACVSLALALGGSAIAGAAGAPAHGNTRPAAAFPLDGHNMAEMMAEWNRRAAAARPIGAGAAATHPASMIPVTSCEDDGSAGTLRHAILTANNGDTVDLSALHCSVITLASGAIDVNVDDLVVQGPGAGALTIDGNDAGRVFFHGGTGTLSLYDVAVRHGKMTGDAAYGGCIYSKGNVELTRSIIQSCTADGNIKAAGGGIVSFGNVTLSDSAVDDNIARVSAGLTGTVSAAGGGILARYQLTLIHSTLSGNTAQANLGQVYSGGAVAYDASAKYSTISDNETIALGVGNDLGGGGGLIGTRSIFLDGSTIDHNQADVGGGLIAFTSGASPFTTIIQSTISYNTALGEVGGAFVSSVLQMSSSTVAFNQSGPIGGGGVIVDGASAAFESTIIADNSPSGAQAAADLDGSATISGSHNLIKLAGAMMVLPADTISLDPQLGALVNNGGATRTHAVGAGSPAVDAGSNPGNFDWDQRGAGFARSIGTAPDIGAYESDPDRIFAHGFE